MLLTGTSLRLAPGAVRSVPKQPRRCSSVASRWRPLALRSRCLPRAVAAFRSSTRPYSTQSQDPPPQSISPERPASPSATPPNGSTPNAPPPLPTSLQSLLAVASETLNKVTGYSAIEAIKINNTALEHSLQSLQARVRSARQTYKTINARRSSTQREVAALLARKDAWTPSDLERFTELYRVDHALESEASAAGETLGAVESEEQAVAAALISGMSRKYHEEQVWSDKIRRVSTWGTWALMGVNVLLLFIVEPWRRRRLVRGVAEEEKIMLAEVRDRLDEEQAALEMVKGQLSEISRLVRRDVATEAVAEVAGLRWEDAVRPDRWGRGIADLGSKRLLHLRMRDATLFVVNGLVVGAAVGASVFWLLQR